MFNNQKPIDTTPFKHLYPFKSNFLELNGHKYHYLDEGNGEPIVMLHGNPTWSFYYRSLVESLSPQYRAIVPDHIGCGFSDKPDPDIYGYTLKNRVDDLEMLIDHLKIKEKLTLILHDWGGMVGSVYALRHSEKIGRIVITNTAGFFTPSGKYMPFRLWLIRHIVPFAKIGVLGFNLFSVGALFMAPKKRLSNDVKAGLIAPYNCWRNRIATLKFVLDIPVKETDPSYQIVQDTQDNLHKLSKIPKLICWGEHDFAFPLVFLAEWKRRFPDAEVHQFPDAGHYILEDIPQKVITLTKKFLKNHPL